MEGVRKKSREKGVSNELTRKKKKTGRKRNGGRDLAQPLKKKEVKIKDSYENLGGNYDGNGNYKSGRYGKSHGKFGEGGGAMALFRRVSEIDGWGKKGGF